MSGHAYRGVNALQLSVTQTAKGYRDNRWATATQDQALGGQVRPGEQATPVLFDTADDERQAQQPPGAPDTGQRPGGEQVPRAVLSTDGEGARRVQRRTGRRPEAGTARRRPRPMSPRGKRISSPST